MVGWLGVMCVCSCRCFVVVCIRGMSILGELFVRWKSDNSWQDTTLLCSDMKPRKATPKGRTTAETLRHQSMHSASASLDPLAVG